MRSLFLFLLVGAATLGHAQFVAFHYPTGPGNQAFSGALGMDFDVNSAISVVSLGIFDSNQDGIKNNIDCILYNRDTHAVVVSKSFSPSNMGFGLYSANFLDLASPVILQAGFHGTIVAQGYGVLERNGNSISSTNSFATLLDTGGGLITFTGKSRNGAFGTYPTTTDLNAAQYGAGDFKFVAYTPPVPEPASLASLALGAAFLARRRRKSTNP